MRSAWRTAHAKGGAIVRASEAKAELFPLAKYKALYRASLAIAFALRVANEANVAPHLLVVYLLHREAR
jgi:hypothetical protein